MWTFGQATDRLSGIHLLAHAIDLNPFEALWPLGEREELANRAATGADHTAAVLRRSLQRQQTETGRHRLRSTCNGAGG
ncbi:hypothetical protein [Nocardiopsis baichengensis]|uniref:hypothetical protein n=1 Tax=Nocardiopsis baichengensis TaxID=280240 RepID=UPI0003498035|nr:hypothetical protein [Nocardiopsis baichengensis]